MSEQNYEEIEFREIDREKKVRKKKNYMLRFLIAVCVIAAMALFLASGFFDVSRIEVRGNSYYKDDEIINLADAQTGKNIFWGSDLGGVRENLEDDPYFTDISVRRRLPDTLVITVAERRQTAAIVYGDQYVVIDRDGTVLRRSSVDPKITLLTGLTISRLTVGETVAAEESVTLKNTLDLLDAMKDGDLFFKKIDVSGIVLKAYIYDTLVVKGTVKQLEKAIESGDLQKVLNNLFNNDMTRGTINLGEHNYMSVSPEFR